MLDRADCADFGCHNSIRLETEHFLNTLALTFISFSGCFVFAMQKYYLFFCERSSSLFLKLWHLQRKKMRYLACSNVVFVSLDKSRGYLEFSTATPLLPQRFPFGRDNLKNILVRHFKFGMWVYIGNVTNAIVL